MNKFSSRMCKLKLAATGLIFVCLSGCFSTKYIESKHYLLDIKTPIKTKNIESQRSLFVAQIHAAAPFDQVNFLYRISNAQYVTDYYHSFLASPSEQIKLALTTYLKTIGKFKLETEESLSSNKLQVQLIELYADYRDRTKPKAVVTLKFILTRKNNDKNIIILDKTFHNELPLAGKTTDELLASWSLGIQDILNGFVNSESHRY